MQSFSKIAVTGASGHLGNTVCRVLLEHGFSVNAFYNSDKKALENLAVNSIQGSVLNQESLSDLLQGCDAVIHCAAIISINGDPTGIVHKTNTEGAKNVAEVSKKLGVKKSFTSAAFMLFWSIRLIYLLMKHDSTNSKVPMRMIIQKRGENN